MNLIYLGIMIFVHKHMLKNEAEKVRIILD